jgi:hypothetical protein
MAPGSTDLLLPVSFARRFMERSQLAVLSILSSHQIYSTPSNHFRLPLPVYPLSQTLQIAERFYQTPLYLPTIREPETAKAAYNEFQPFTANLQLEPGRPRAGTVTYEGKDHRMWKTTACSLTLLVATSTFAFGGTTCERLKSLSLPNATITANEPIC